MNTKLKAFWLLAKAGIAVGVQRKDLDDAKRTIKWQSDRVRQANRVIDASSGAPVLDVDLRISPADERRALTMLVAPAERAEFTKMAERVETASFSLTGMLCTRLSIRFPMGEYHHQVHDMLDALAPQIVDAAQRVADRGLSDLRTQIPLTPPASRVG